MHYTVKQLAKISNISIRALHWYDKKGLLKPAYRYANGYRYYEEEQLLLLQQILFFKELGFNLNDIQKLLSQDDFDKLKALKTHRQILVNDIHRKDRLINTINKTISRLRGKDIMTNEELYDGFISKTKQAEYEDYLSNKLNKEICYVRESEHTKNWTKQDMRKAMQEFNNICKNLSLLMNKSASVESEKVQKLVNKHYVWIKQFWTPDKDSYIKLGVGYTELEWKKTFEAYDPHHPRLAKFLADAMRIYAKKNL